MTENPAASDWAATRGERWRDQLSGLEAMLAPVDAPLVEALRLELPLRIADVGCGGGGTTLEIQRLAPPGSVVHGYDISPALIETARTRAPLGEDAIAFSVADAGVARPEEAYDRLVSRFGIMFYDDPPSAFANLARWLLPGGRFAFAVWGQPNENPWMTSMRAVAAEILDLPVPDPEAPGPFRYAGAQKLLGLLDDAGFTDLAVRDWRGTLSLGGGLAPEDAANFALSSFAIGEQVADAGQDVLAAVREALAAHYAQHHRDGAVQLDARVHIVTGARPRAA
jgi:SAM-dependent methyltransferase